MDSGRPLGYVGGVLNPEAKGRDKSWLLYLAPLLKHDIHIKPKSYKLELLGELVI